APQAGDTVLAPADFERVEPRQLLRRQRDDDLAAAFDGHGVALAELVEIAGALDAQAGLERARGVVEAGVHDARVVARLVRADALLALDHVDTEVRSTQEP